MKGFIDYNQHLELHPEVNQGPVWLRKRRCHMGKTRYIDYIPQLIYHVIILSTTPDTNPVTNINLFSQQQQQHMLYFLPSIGIQSELAAATIQATGPSRQVFEVQVSN